MPSYATIHLYLRNIPASEKEPFQIKLGDKIIAESKQDITSTVISKVQVEEPALASFHKIYLNILIPMCDIDELNQYNLTENGYYFEVSTANLKLKVKQGYNDQFGLLDDKAKGIDDNSKFEIDERTGEFVYKKNKPVYMRDGYEKKKPVVTESQTADSSSSSDSTRVWFHLSGIEASEEEPFVLSVANQPVFRYSKPIGKRQQFPVYIKKLSNNAQNHHEIDLHISMPALGVNADQHFNLSTSGVQIMIAVIDNGSNIKILQEKERDKLPNYDSQYTTTTPSTTTSTTTTSTPSKPTTTTTTTSFKSTGKGFPHKIHIYSNNIPASSQEPYRVSVNGQILLESKKNISQSEMSAAICEIEPPASGDLIIEVRFEVVSRGVDAEQQFNITKNGPFILFQIVTDGDDERIAMKQQHKDTFGGNQSSSGTPPKASMDVETVSFHLNNVPASNVKPFELLVNDQPIFKCVDDLSTPDQKDRVAIVSGRIPKPRSGDHIVSLTVKAPLVTRDDKIVELNLANGKYIKVYMDDSDKSQVQVIQSKTDQFPQQQQQQVKQSSASTTIDYLAELEKLASLRDAGILTQDEFDQKKKKILGL